MLPSSKGLVVIFSFTCFLRVAVRRAYIFSFFFKVGKKKNFI